MRPQNLQFSLDLVCCKISIVQNRTLYYQPVNCFTVETAIVTQKTVKMQFGHTKEKRNTFETFQSPLVRPLCERGP
jgi:hypothetical protein